MTIARPRAETPRAHVIRNDAEAIEYHAIGNCVLNGKAPPRHPWF